MRLVTCAVLLLASVCSVISTEADDGTPSLKVLAVSLVFEADQKKAIYCKGANLPERLEWYSPSNQKIEEKSTSNTRVFVERLKEAILPLIINPAKIEDSGNWTCKSGNLSETIEILVGVKVNLTERYKSIEDEEGKSVKLDCVAQGYPLPFVQWYKDARPIIAKEHPKKYVIKKKDDNYQLTIKNLSYSDSGDYDCRVTQEALSYYTDKRVQVIVQHKPLLINTMIKEGTSYGVEETYVLINETKNITCKVLAYPPPMYRWFRRYSSSYDEPIEDQDSVLHSEDGSSSILQLRVRDERALGEYMCTANNTKGHIAIVFDVSLGNKPSPPDEVSIIEERVNEVTFNITCSNCTISKPEEGTPIDPKNLPISGFKFQLVPVNGSLLPDWDTAYEIEVPASLNDTVYVVGPLPNSTIFYARVCTQNEAGDSVWFDITPNPQTGQAVKLVASLLLLIATIIFTGCF
ncbi:limbic system-associated membrane protein [Epargyreus clarus]|uniref:limbic system-associated membrane protein n=1 Tax=Epargyreus clarus TaxID=520877 RepID=UPI003C2C85BC